MRSWFALIITLIVSLPALAFEPRVCAELFAKDRRALNPTAVLSATQYRAPNDRKWRDYVHALFRGFDEAKAAFQDGETVIDLGGGQGRAMNDLTTVRDLRAIVINTQDFSDRFPGNHRLSYRTGWAEEVLPELPADFASGIFDVFGAFHYSVHKDVLLESAYRVLKPGRSAYLLFDFETAPAFVGRFRLDHWLRARWPKIFSLRMIDIGGRTVSVIKMTKRNWDWRPLKLRLEIKSAGLNPERPGFPMVTYELKPGWLRRSW